MGFGFEPEEVFETGIIEDGDIELTQIWANWLGIEMQGGEK
jgi:hypothetical protein